MSTSRRKFLSFMPLVGSSVTAPLSVYLATREIPNLELPRFYPGDTIRSADFNKAFADIESAITALQDAYRLSGRIPKL